MITEEVRVSPVKKPADKALTVVLRVEYDGSPYQGWQRQPHTDDTVQQKLEEALSQVANEPIKVFCAGRTDTGVHGLGQIVHFYTNVERPDKAWVLGANRYLPDSVAVTWAGRCEGDFHARFSAIARRYLYVILNRPQRAPAVANRVTWWRHPLDAEAMNIAAQPLLGEHDFAAIQASSCSAHTSIRQMQRLEVTRHGQFVLIDVQANAFLHHMVRNLVGTLLPVGAGLQSPEWVAEVIASGDRTLAGVTAPPDGLYLWQVHYPAFYGIPREDALASPMLALIQ